jgi:hypothetical protein
LILKSIHWSSKTIHEYIDHTDTPRNKAERAAEPEKDNELNFPILVITNEEEEVQRVPETPHIPTGRSPSFTAQSSSGIEDEVLPYLLENVPDPDHDLEEEINLLAATGQSCTLLERLKFVRTNSALGMENRDSSPGNTDMSIGDDGFIPEINVVDSEGFSSSETLKEPGLVKNEEKEIQKSRVSDEFVQEEGECICKDGTKCHSDKCKSLKRRITKIKEIKDYVLHLPHKPGSVMSRKPSIHSQLTGGFMAKNLSRPTLSRHSKMSLPIHPEFISPPFHSIPLIWKQAWFVIFKGRALTGKAVAKFCLVVVVATNIFAIVYNIF